ncbi:MAG: hypothetical protein IID45_05240 [Planctomycetes bacterium]|nr:hypothetical protein [Planctomycetota bacterium]
MTETAVWLGSESASLRELDDSAFLQAVRWNRSAPGKMVQAAREGDIARFCRLLAKRGGAVTTASGQKSAGRKNVAKPSLWSSPAFEDSVRSAELVRIWESFGSRLKRKKGKQRVESTRKENRTAETQLGEWLSSVETDVTVRPFELLVLSEILLTVGRVLSPLLVCELWRTTLTSAVELTEQLADPSGCQATAEQQTVIAGELPVQIGLMFAGVKGAGTLLRRGWQRLSRDLWDATDNDGTPHAKLLPRMPVWLAPFVRSREISLRFRQAAWNDKTEGRYRALIRIVTLMCRTDGRLALANGLAVPVLPILNSALRTAGFKKGSSPMRFLSAVNKTVGKNGKPKRPRRSKIGKPSGGKSVKKKRSDRLPAAQSDWAELAVLRSDWSISADSLVVAHDAEYPRIELAAMGVPLFSGVWEIELTVAGERLETGGKWSCSCWFSDADADFIELQHQCDDGLCIDRQILLSRKNHFVLLADCVSGAPFEARIDYASRLPLAGEISVNADVPTRECRLNGDGIRARAFPLALPSDRVLSAPGEFGKKGDHLELRQSAISGLYAPLIIDWSPRRKRSAAQWRTLTVSEDGEKLTSEKAAGHRIRLGNHHLLVYRAVTTSEKSRTVLGHHTLHETVIGRFNSNGEIEPILLVE